MQRLTVTASLWRITKHTYRADKSTYIQPEHTWINTLPLTSQGTFIQTAHPKNNSEITQTGFPRSHTHTLESDGWTEGADGGGEVARRVECVRGRLVLSLCFPLHWRLAHLANGIGCSHRSAWGRRTLGCREGKKKRKMDGGVNVPVSPPVWWAMNGRTWEGWRENNGEKVLVNRCL